ncbi:hypothetical protein [Kitasatospora sp. CB01950]|uniref:hypothetical protein n=1 Tax=Kitasatospora sp. CB01950 TaxID=1703930 RepID=UPI000938CF81|nr:hypothetical protein [Kitasatospora sp. CB01950]OKI95081.1 hypothetical protein AMK19_32945 [Kitasatospora sp. CB01950]
MTVAPDIPPKPAYTPDPPSEAVTGFWLGPRTRDGSEAMAELAAEIRQARLDDAIPIKADDADHLIDWQRVRSATRRLIRTVQAWPNVAALTGALAGPAWLWRHVVASCSTSFAPLADTADPGLCLGVMSLIGALVVHQAVRGNKLLRPLSPLSRIALWSIVAGTLAHPPAAVWAAALLEGTLQ